LSPVRKSTSWQQARPRRDATFADHALQDPPRPCLLAAVLPAGAAVQEPVREGDEVRGASDHDPVVSRFGFSAGGGDDGGDDRERDD
jgi:hypothetical protein